MFSLASKTSAKKLPQRFEVVSSGRDGNSTDSHNIPTSIQAGDVMVIYIFQML
jgi:co-chaperonin GroES (HSP10)